MYHSYARQFKAHLSPLRLLPNTTERKVWGKLVLFVSLQEDAIL